MPKTLDRYSSIRLFSSFHFEKGGGKKERWHSVYSGPKEWRKRSWSNRMANVSRTTPCSSTENKPKLNAHQTARFINAWTRRPMLCEENDSRHVKQRYGWICLWNTDTGCCAACNNIGSVDERRHTLKSRRRKRKNRIRQKQQIGRPISWWWTRRKLFSFSSVFTIDTVQQESLSGGFIYYTHVSKYILLFLPAAGFDFLPVLSSLFTLSLSLNGYWIVQWRQAGNDTLAG